MFIVPITRMQPVAGIEGTMKPVSANNGGGSVFSDILKNAISETTAAQAQSEQDAYDLAMGKTDDLHTVMINSEKFATSLEMTTQLVSRVVGAYNEIMRMQV